jgi:hypothetical protein
MIAAVVVPQVAFEGVEHFGIVVDGEDDRLGHGHDDGARRRKWHHARRSGRCAITAAPPGG